jgi:hypothetical protein
MGRQLNVVVEKGGLFAILLKSDEEEKGASS